MFPHCIDDVGKCCPVVTATACKPICHDLFQRHDDDTLYRSSRTQEMHISQGCHLLGRNILFGEQPFDERGTMLKPKIVLPTVGVIATECGERDIWKERRCKEAVLLRVSPLFTLHQQGQQLLDVCVACIHRQNENFIIKIFNLNLKYVYAIARAGETFYSIAVLFKRQQLISRCVN